MTVGRAAIVSGIIALAHSLEFSVIAEGVDKPEQLAWLKKRAVTTAGFLLPDRFPHPSLRKNCCERNQRKLIGNLDSSTIPVKLSGLTPLEQEHVSVSKFARETMGQHFSRRFRLYDTRCSESGAVSGDESCSPARAGLGIASFSTNLSFAFL